MPSLNHANSPATTLSQTDSKQFRDCRVVIYPRDHRPPHVHVEFRDGDRCTVEIETLLVTGVVRPSAKLKTSLVWIAANRKQLLAKWKEIVR